LSPSILAVLNRIETAHPVLAAASLAADRLREARIEALHVRHDAMEGFMPTEEVMTEGREREIEGDAARQSADLQSIFDAWRRESGTGTWREVTGETAKVISNETARADLIVIDHASSHGQGDAGQAIHAALFDVRAPTLLVPEEVPLSLGRLIAVAWKPGEAADRAIEAALPLLLQAEKVAVLIGTEDGGGETPADLMTRLEQAQIPVEVRHFQAGDRKIGQALLAEAHARSADLLVMGAYTRNRLVEMVLGGATRDVLATADLPVLLRH